MTSRYNEALIRETVAAIEVSPERWQQRHWVSSCGTTMCFAGMAWAQYFGKLHNDGHFYPQEIRFILGLSQPEADEIFFLGFRRVLEWGYEFEYQPTIDELKAKITEVTGIEFKEE